MNTDTADRWTEIGQLFTAKNAPLVEKFASLVASRDLASFEKAKASLDLASVLERCDLLLETVGTVTRTPLSSANRLFQKNAWAMRHQLWPTLASRWYSVQRRAMAATTPPPPARFSTMTGWPSSFDINSAKMRVVVSPLPPAPKPTTKLMGRVGQVSARPECPAAAKNTRVINARVSQRWIEVMTPRLATREIHNRN